MSIAAVSRSFVAAINPTRSVEGRDAARAAHRHHEPREAPGRRSELIDAMNRALGVPADATKAQTQAVFRFAKALMHDLREIEGGDDGEHRGGGKASGRREWNDLPQRLTALAAAAAREPSAPEHADAELPDMHEAPVAAKVTEMPKPATPASIAVHMAKVPSSHLLQAFVAMQRALGREQDESSARSGLSTLATQLASALQPGTKSELPAGSVIHLTA
jgi:hypothetical protein